MDLDRRGVVDCSEFASRKSIVLSIICRGKLDRIGTLQLPPLPIPLARFSKGFWKGGLSLLVACEEDIGVGGGEVLA
jgi:hypothetical protein